MGLVNLDEVVVGVDLELVCLETTFCLVRFQHVQFLYHELWKLDK